jgi:hypothetical protein
VSSPGTSGPQSFGNPPHPTTGNQYHAATIQLGESLWMLEKTFAWPSSEKVASSSTGRSPAHDWHARWQELQQWYSRRETEMQQIIDLDDESMQRFQHQDSVEFSCILFSNVCAAIGNVAHHVASAVLLQSKPRLVKPAANQNSSTSSLWHNHRALSIISTASEAGIWDPFMTASLLYCSRKLSNGKQIYSLAKKLEKIQSLSGLELNKSISDLEELARKV